MLPTGPPALSRFGEVENTLLSHCARAMSLSGAPAREN